MPTDIVDRLNTLRITVNSCLDALRKIESTIETVRQKVLRAQTLATRFADDLDAVLRVSSTSVPFVSGTSERPELVIAPLDVGPILAEFVWPMHTAIMTSATIPLSMPERIGLSPDKVHVLDVGSPFNYEEQGRLYCATHLPDPNAQRDDAVHDELATLITAAGGRTLALFTSRRALTFLLDETSCLFATAGFFEGVDIPGRALSLVVIDRIPFPHRNNPLLAARRDLHGAKGFTEIDLPRAITALAQATGRLIRTRTDKGVVAVLDPRLASKSYRWSIINALPPLKRIKDINEATEFLKEITQ
jgi:ATP-dependent DNA helicase DinG